MKAISKFVLTSLFSVLLLSVFSPLSVFAAPATPSGSGTEADPYLISTVSHLEWVADQVNNQGNSFQNKFLKLSNDIDVADWTSDYPSFIGINSWSPFNGTFDGNGHKLLNLTKINTSNYMDTGLFAYIGNSSVVKNLGLVDVNISTAAGSAGAITARNIGTIFNVYATGTVTNYEDGAGGAAGGLVGANVGSISASYAAVNVIGTQGVGGLVGENVGTLNNVFATGNVGGIYHVGGLVGKQFVEGTISSSYATGDLFDVAPIGTTSGERYFGGLVGGTVDTSTPNITYSYWNTDSSIQVAGEELNTKFGYGGGDTDGIFGKTTSEMVSAEFAQLLNTNRSISSVEWIATGSDNGGYPFLTFSSGGETGGGTGGTGGTGGSSEGDPSQEYDIKGTVTATWIIVTVPTSVSFALLPDAVEQFVSVPFQVQNQSVAPVEVKFLGVRSTDQTSPKVVSAEKYSEQGWRKLPVSKSASEIALGIQSDGATIWSPAEVESQVPDTVAGSINVDRLDSKSVKLDGKHGNAFTSSKVMNYQMYLRVGLAS